MDSRVKPENDRVSQARGWECEISPRMTMGLSLAKEKEE
jgi:hypothetical protein